MYTKCIRWRKRVERAFRDADCFKRMTSTFFMGTGGGTLTLANRTGKRGVWNGRETGEGRRKLTGQN